ncbi:hypothetical protein EYC80_004428 [Monilinia laxa]|uniref:Uncharacterized protein n=1 Tax=Monilinia laxa TaxID=61186 RepID=A0A5N6KMU1_MONLA|nr:hypothetical protein EYC80_004428 [Monilinia laxa]
MNLSAEIVILSRKEDCLNIRQNIVANERELYTVHCEESNIRLQIWVTMNRVGQTTRTYGDCFRNLKYHFSVWNFRSFESDLTIPVFVRKVGVTY